MVVDPWFEERDGGVDECLGVGEWKGGWGLGAGDGFFPCSAKLVVDPWLEEGWGRGADECLGVGWGRGRGGGGLIRALKTSNEGAWAISEVVVPLGDGDGERKTEDCPDLC